MTFVFSHHKQKIACCCDNNHTCNKPVMALAMNRQICVQQQARNMPAVLNMLVCGPTSHRLRMLIVSRCILVTFASASQSEPIHAECFALAGLIIDSVRRLFPVLLSWWHMTNSLCTCQLFSNACQPIDQPLLHLLHNADLLYSIVHAFVLACMYGA